MITSEKVHGLTDEEIAFYEQNGYVLAKGVFTREEAAKLVATTSPKLVIPMAYGDGAASEDIAAFLEEAGLEAQEPTSSITVTRSSLPEDKIETVILESRTKEKKSSGAMSAAVGTDLEG